MQEFGGPSNGSRKKAKLEQPESGGKHEEKGLRVEGKDKGEGLCREDIVSKCSVRLKGSRGQERKTIATFYSEGGRGGPKDGRIKRA